MNMAAGGIPCHRTASSTDYPDEISVSPTGETIAVESGDRHSDSKAFDP